MNKAFIITIAALALGLAGDAWAQSYPNPTFQTNGATAFSPIGTRNAALRYAGADFGADLSGATNATPAIQACLNATGLTGGICIIEPTATPLLDTTLTIPASTTLQCGFGGLPDTPSGQNYPSPFAQMAHLSLNSAATISRAGGGSVLRNCAIFRKGMTFPASDASAYAGTALTITGEKQGSITENVLIIGFGLCMSASGDRVIVRDFNCDATAGITAANSFDVSSYRHLTFWPFGTVGANAGSPPNSALLRTGTAFRTTGESDNTNIDELEVFGWATGVDLQSNGNLMIGRLWLDNNASYGLLIGNVSATSIEAATIYTTGVAVTLDGGDIRIGNLLIYTTVNDCVDIHTGNLFVSQMVTQSCGGAAVSLSTTASYLRIGSFVTRSNVGASVICLPSGATTDKYDIRFITDQAAGASIYGCNQMLFPAVAAAGSLPIPVNGDTFTVSGTTGITSIQGAGGGRRITLLFAGALTVNTAGNIHLAGGGNFTTSAGSMLTLLYDAASGLWREVSRANP